MANKKGGRSGRLLSWRKYGQENEVYNGRKVECNKETGRVEIIKDGKAVEGYDKVSINQLYQIQARAERM